MKDGRYYVYTLTDPRDGKVFYVGKGRGNRVDAHERQAKRGIKSPKCDRIREIVAAGLAVIKEKVAFFDCEGEAYKFESRMILSMDGLTNAQKIEKDPIRAKYRSREFMEILAWAIRFRSGAYKPIDDPRRPWSSAVSKMFCEKADGFIRRAAQHLSAKEIKDGLAPLGILVTG